MEGNLQAAGCKDNVELTWCEAAPKPKTWHPQPGVCRCSGSPNVFAWLLPSLEIVDVSAMTIAAGSSFASLIPHPLPCRH